MGGEEEVEGLEGCLWATWPTPTRPSPTQGITRLRVKARARASIPGRAMRLARVMRPG